MQYAIFIQVIIESLQEVRVLTPDFDILKTNGRKNLQPRGPTLVKDPSLSVQLGSVQDSSKLGPFLGLDLISSIEVNGMIQGTVQGLNFAILEGILHLLGQHCFDFTMLASFLSSLSIAGTSFSTISNFFLRPCISLKVA
jgi:hypothetical protein